MKRSHLLTSSVLLETRSQPALARCYPRSQLPVRLGPFYVARPTRSILTSCFFLLILFSASAETSPSPDSAKAAPSVASPSVQSAIVAAVEEDRKRFGGHEPIPATLIGVWDSKGGSFIRAFGYADLEKKLPLTPADHFRIGSNTKTFVISALLQLVGEKKLSLDDPLSRFALGVTIPNAEGITVRELCNMRSGLFEAYDTPEFARLNMKVPENFNPRTLVEWAVQQKPYFAPGTGYRYSNTNYLLIGMIIEEITKDSVGNQIRKRLLEPFGLKQTSYPETEAMPNPWVHGYHLDKQGNWKDISNTIPVAFMGSARRDDFRYERHQALDRAVRHRQDDWSRNLPGSHQLHSIPG
jgi:CubicO group peptidase (beta-lactamase class C family)